MMCKSFQNLRSHRREEAHSVSNRCQGPRSPAGTHEWRDAEDLPLMVELPAGEFVMGENPGDKYANDTERPAHQVRFPGGFALGRFPVTVGEFRKFHHEHAPEEADDLPVVRVNWHDATAYCGWLTAFTGREYRLASEAEWEYACRAGTRNPFAVGDEITTRQANFLYDETGTRIGPGRRTPVGSYPPNQFGLHDLHGNVGEWVGDSWHPNYLGAPGGGRAWYDAENRRRVVRGGAWDYLPRLLRCSWRDWRLAEERADNIGFRVASDYLK
jgi:formylglycine-generating enzyme required for sulfatase activity